MEELEVVIEADYEAGCIIRDKILPRAVDWYTGDVVDSDMEMDGSEMESDSDQEVFFNSKKLFFCHFWCKNAFETSFSFFNFPKKKQDVDEDDDEEHDEEKSPRQKKQDQNCNQQWERKWNFNFFNFDKFLFQINKILPWQNQGYI